MPFFRYRQNNSGGRFNFNASRGISVNVYVEAANSQAADERAEKIGLYFDGQGDCECCGPRWYRNGTWLSEEFDTCPTEVIVYYHPWAKACAEGYVHMLDGRILPLPIVHADTGELTEVSCP